jgi:ankyrin repeat protein
MAAECEGNTAILKQLIKAGAEIDHTDRFGQTALFVAATQEKAAACECLLQTGAVVSRLDIKDDDGQNILSDIKGMSLAETRFIFARYYQYSWSSSSKGQMWIYDAVDNRRFLCLDLGFW